MLKYEDQDRMPRLSTQPAKAGTLNAPYSDAPANECRRLSTHHLQCCAAIANDLFRSFARPRQLQRGFCKAVVGHLERPRTIGLHIRKPRHRRPAPIQVHEQLRSIVRAGTLELPTHPGAL